MKKLLAILAGILAELTDQRAYRTYLAWHGVEHSADQWRRFCDQRWAAKARRGRCC